MIELAKIDRAAVLKAVITSVVLGLVIGAAVGFVGVGLAVAGVLTEDVLENSFVLHGIICCLGLLPNVVVGYLAASFAGQNEMLNGVVAGSALLAITGLFYLFPSDAPFTFLDGVVLFLLVPLAVGGAAIQKRTQ